jgi:hypothetical protein
MAGHATTESCAFPLPVPSVKPARKHFRQARVLADRDQSFGESVKFLAAEGAALLGGDRGFIALVATLRMT